MKKRRSNPHFTGILALSLSLCPLLPVSAQGRTKLTPRLETQRRYKTPRDTVLQYTARDAHGFYWIGMLQTERESLTRWSTSPQPEGAYLISRYEVGEAVPLPASQNRERSEVTVTYHLVGISDLLGQITPPARYIETVRFELDRNAPSESWKITSPASESIHSFVHYSTFEDAVP